MSQVDRTINIKQFWRIMAIIFDSIQPASSVTVATSQNNNLVKVGFARVLDQDVLKDMQELKVRPFVRAILMDSNQRVFDVIVDSNYSLADVAEATAQMLEGHRMKVKRQVGLGGREEVSSFLQLTQEGDRS